jgi:response regulator of citrate/malate metabolism
MSLQQQANAGQMVKSYRVKRAVLTALADNEIMKILASSMNQSKSVNQILKETNISHTTAFRKTKWLLKEWLIIVDKIIITPDGKKFSLYLSTLKAITARYEANNVSVEAEPNSDIPRKRIEKFFSID